MDWGAVSRAVRVRSAQFGWKAKDLAHYSGLSLSTVRSIQRHDATRPRCRQTLRALSTALGFQPEHLLLIARGTTSEERRRAEKESILVRLGIIDCRLQEFVDKVVTRRPWSLPFLSGRLSDLTVIVERISTALDSNDSEDLNTPEIHIAVADLQVTAEHILECVHWLQDNPLTPTAEEPT